MSTRANTARRAPLALLLLCAACGTGSPASDTGPGVDAHDAVALVDRAPPVDAFDASTDVSADVSADAHEGLVPFAYVGTGDGNITVYAVDRTTAALTVASQIHAGDYPSYLAFDTSARHVYAVNESSAQVAAFAIDPHSGALTAIDTQPSGGDAPTHLSIDPSGRHVLVANYFGGTASVFPIDATGALGAATANPMPGVNPHCIFADPSDHFVFVLAKGSDWISQYLFDPSAGTLRPNASPRVATASGAGPRHLAFHPTAAFAYVINETDSTVVVYAFDRAHGTLAPVQTVSTLPAGFTGSNTAAELLFAPSGRFLYGSNRGHDSIVTYAVDASTGRLTLVGHTSTGGRSPRDFGIDPRGAWLFVANQQSNNVVAFDLDATTGALTRRGTTSTTSAPFYVGIAWLAGP